MKLFILSIKTQIWMDWAMLATLVTGACAYTHSLEPILVLGGIGGGVLLLMGGLTSISEQER